MYTVLFCFVLSGFYEEGIVDPYALFFPHFQCRLIDIGMNTGPTLAK